MYQSSSSISHVFFPVSFVLRPVLPYLFATSMSQFVLELAYVISRLVYFYWTVIS
jgi:hypothetical protein